MELSLNLPDADRSALEMVCTAHLAGQHLPTWQVEERWGSDVLVRLRMAGLVRVVSESTIEGSWRGWGIAFPDKVAAYRKLLADLQSEVRSGGIPSSVSAEQGALLRIMPRIDGLELADGTNGQSCDIRITVARFAPFNLDQLSSQVTSYALHSLPILHMYGMRDFANVQPSFGLSMKGANLAGSTIKDSNFGTVDLSGICFDNCVFERCTFERTVIQDASFRSAKFTRCLVRPRDLRGTTLEGAEFLDHSELWYPWLLDHTTWDVLHFEGQPYYRTGPAPLIVEKRPLGWEMIFRGESRGTLDLKSMPVLAGLISHPDQPIHVLDAESCVVRPVGSPVGGPPAKLELRDLLTAARLDEALEKGRYAQLDDMERWRLAAIARRLILLDELEGTDAAALLPDDRASLREFVVDHLRKPKLSLPQGTGPVKKAVARVCAGLQELVDRTHAADPELGSFLDSVLERQEFCCFKQRDQRG
jgi:hypothetical protein